MVHEKRESQKHNRSPMATNGDYTLFRLAVFVFLCFFLLLFLCLLLFSLVPCMFCAFRKVLSSHADWWMLVVGCRQKSG